MGATTQQLSTLAELTDPKIVERLRAFKPAQATRFSQDSWPSGCAAT